MKHMVICISVVGVLLLASCSKTVYICNGPYSKAYHTTEDCFGLGNCSTDVEEVSLREAKGMGRHACHLCKDNDENYERDN